MASTTPTGERAPVTASALAIFSELRAATAAATVYRSGCNLLVSRAGAALYALRVLERVPARAAAFRADVGSHWALHEAFRGALAFAAECRSPSPLQAACLGRGAVAALVNAIASAVEAHTPLPAAVADVLAAEAEDTPDALHVVVAGAGLPVAPSSVPTFEEIYAAAAPAGALEEAVSAAVAALRAMGWQPANRGGPPVVDAYGATPPVVVDVAGTPTALEVVVAGAAGAPEARALRVRLGVRHPNVVSLYGVLAAPGGGADGEPAMALATEAHPAGSLAAALGSAALDPLAVRLNLLLDIAQGLTFLHANDLVHLDLHPGNILLGGPAGPARLARPRMYPSDTPTALFYASESTTPAELRAKTYTVSPEVARKEPASAAADVWALGSVAYALLSRGDPYPAGPSAAAGAEALAELLLAGTPPAGVVSIFYNHCFTATASRRSPAWMVLHHLFALRERSPGLFGRAPVRKGALDGGSPATDPELRALFPLRFRGRPPSGADPLPDWRRRAAAGEADACWNLHACYRRGQYVVRDVGLAIGWLFKYKRALDAEEATAGAEAAMAAAEAAGGAGGDTYANGHATGGSTHDDAFDGSGGISVRQAVSLAPGGGGGDGAGGYDASDLGGLAAAVMAGIPSDVGSTTPRRGGRGLPLGGRTQSTPDRAAAASSAAAGASAVAAAAEAAAAADGGGTTPYAGVAKTESGQAAERELVDWLESRVAADLDAEDSDGEWAYALALALDLHVGGREQSRARAAELYAMAAARSHGDATNVLGERHAAAGAARRAAAAYLTAESLGCVAASVNRARALCDPGVVGRRPGASGAAGGTSGGAVAAPPPAPLPGVPAAPTLTVQEADAATALAFYEAAAYAGSTEALHLSAQCHAAGLGLPAPAPYHAFERWRLAAERGHGDSLYAVAHCFATGSGVGRSPSAAADYLRRAAAKGVPAALNELGEHVRGGDDPPRIANGGAVAAAGGGSPGAPAETAATIAADGAAVGPAYADGDGGDRRKARALFEAAAAAGHPAAKRNLAAELLPTDPAGAAALLHAAASAGDGAAAAELAAIYERGRAGRQAAAAAAAANGGAGGGGAGRAVAKDTLAAHYWHKKAAAAGSRASARKLTSRGFRFAVAAARARALFRGGGGGTSSNKSSPA
ncbi:hypothetical protein MMPV_004815 [Pyropia vietnamensis]